MSEQTKSADVLATPDGIFGEVTRRQLHFFWMVDWSGSMAGSKIQTVNWAIREVLPEIRNLEEKERIRVSMRAIRFGDRAEWYVGPDPVPVSDFNWVDLEVKGGRTATAGAVDLLASALDVEKIGSRNVPPVCILLSDGYCTEPEGRYAEAISRLNALPWGTKAVRLSIGIADDTDRYNKDELDLFISPYLRDEQRIETLHADSPRKLLDYVRFVSTEAVRASSDPKASGGNKPAVAARIDRDRLASAPDVDYGNINAADSW